MSSQLKVNSIRDTSNNEAITISSGNVSFNNTISAGTLGSSVVLPAGTLLQAKYLNSTGTIASGGGSGSFYFKADGSGWSTTQEFAISLTTTQANSNFYVTGFAHPKYTSGQNYFLQTYYYIGHHTASSSTDGDVTYQEIARPFADARSTNNITGQELHPVIGNHLFDLSLSAGVTHYFYFKCAITRMDMEGRSCLTIMEIAG